ncbi:MAG: tRNA 5-methoxyuridine(34)/uridine 5-oxyacetic acid(34) synthase CmoB [Pseudomonadales bacterium]|nr:tRNA 5-methoxyuridine(34)/uridine 5-oxyacetic acid(34) synthase CmoB [Pseudomonadales bacterium]
MVQMHELGIIPCMENVSHAVTDPLALPNEIQELLAGWPLHLFKERFSERHHGDYAKWAAAIASLPTDPEAVLRVGDTVHIETHVSQDLIEPYLQVLHPWRKGPFAIGNTFIDTEWRSDWKWQRLAPAINLAGHNVLDVGSGNGYFGWRMLKAGANNVIGIDPTLLFCMQHLAIQHFAKSAHNFVLPLGIEEIPQTAQFDTVSSMGVIYHRKDPAEHVATLTALTRPGGQVLLESLVSPSPEGFEPNARYARMRNVWRIPSTTELSDWMRQAGLRNIRIVDVTATSLDEQRTTAWMRFESLSEALDSEDPQKTIEGYPAPIRAILVAEK